MKLSRLYGTMKGITRVNVEIDISDYMTPEEIKDECQHAVARVVREQLRSEEDIHRFMSNSSYRFVYDAVDEIFPGDTIKAIAEKIPEIVNGLSAWSVFRPKDAWQREESKGWTILQSVLSESKPLIEARVHELIKEISLEDIQAFVYDEFKNVINNLKKRDANA